MSSSKKKNAYFYAFIPMQIIASAGLAEMIRKTFSNIGIILIRSSHPYSKNVLKETLDSFDRIIEVPYINYKKNPVSGYKSVIKLQNALVKINIRNDDIVFFFVGGELQHLVLNKVNKDQADLIRLVHINENDYSRTDIIRTLLYSIYSLLLKGPIIKVKHSPGNRSAFEYYFKPYHKADLVFANASKDYKPKVKEFKKGLAYPGRFLKLDMEGPVLEYGSILYVLSAEHLADIMDPEEYWTFHLSFIENLRKRFPDKPVYVKQHPAESIETAKEKLGKLTRIIEEEISCEELMLLQKARFAVITTTSTAAIYASMLGIEALLLYKLLPCAVNYKKNWDRYFSGAASELKIIKSIFDLEDLQFNIIDISSGEKEWAQALNKYIDT